MAITTAAEFFAVVEKSRLLTPAQLTQTHKAAGPQADPKTIAKNLVRQDLLTLWQASELLAGRSSFYLGKYRLIEPLGRGGTGNVFLGRHVTMNRRVVLKIVAQPAQTDRASLDGFLAEARAIAALDHPNIVHAFSVDSEGESYYLVMEYIEGLDLQRMVEEEGPLECHRAAEYIRQAAEGLEHAHQRNMIHCNIRPSNLLVNVQGVVKNLDMGLARLVGNAAAASAETVSDAGALRSADYLAPEQAIDGRDLDHRADIYALGCTLYFLLAGHPPLAQAPPAIRAERPGVPVALADLCEKMMAKRPGDRPQTAAEASRSLAAWRQSASLPTRAASLHMVGPLEAPENLGVTGVGSENGAAHGPVGKGRFRRTLARLFGWRAKDAADL
jgi:serine/threonine protein kinase